MKNHSKPIRDLLRELSPIISAKNKTTLIGLIVARLAVALLDIAGIIFLGLVGIALSGDSSSQAAQAFGPIANLAMDFYSPFRLVAAAGLLFIVKSITSAILAQITLKTLAVIETEISTLLFTTLIEPTDSSISNNTIAKLQYGLGFSAYLAFTRIPFSAFNLIADGFLALMIVVLFFVANPLVAAASIVFIGSVVLVFQKLVNRPLRVVGNQLRDEATEIGKTVIETLSIRDELKLFGVSEYFVHKFHRSRQSYSKGHSLERFLTGAPRYFMETTVVAGALLAFVALDMAPNFLNSGSILVFMGGSFRLSGALMPIQQSLANLRSDSPQAQTALNLLNTYQDKITELRARKLVPQEYKSSNLPSPFIEVQNASVHHGRASKAVLSGVSLRIYPGDFIGIIGPSGSGKSTLARIIAGLTQPSSGLVNYDDLNVAQWISQNPRGIGYVPQYPKLVRGSLRDNVALGVSSENIDEKRVDEILHEVGLETLSEKMFHVQGNADEIDLQLSGGQIQRIGIARLIYTRPRIIILDEPTSALDSETEALVNMALNRLFPRVTKILVSHRDSIISNANRVWRVENSRVEEIG